MIDSSFSTFIFILSTCMFPNCHYSSLLFNVVFFMCCTNTPSRVTFVIQCINCSHNDTQPTRSIRYQLMTFKHIWILLTCKKLSEWWTFYLQLFPSTSWWQCACNEGQIKVFNVKEKTMSLLSDKAQEHKFVDIKSDCFLPYLVRDFFYLSYFFFVLHITFRCSIDFF